MISAETRRNFNDFNDMYREIELENEEAVDTQDIVVNRVTSELDDRRLDDVLRWRDGDHYLEAEGYEFDDGDDNDYDYDSDDSGCGIDLGYSLDGDVVFNHRSSDPGYGSDYDVDDDDVSDIED